MTTSTDSLPAMLAYTGATYRQLDFWTRRGLIHPNNPAPGSGHQRIWPTEELIVARDMVRYVAAGLTVEAAHHAARNGGLLPDGAHRIIEETP